MKSANRIVFYDGECGFCNHSVQWLLSLDKRRSLKFAPLQGSTAKELLPLELTKELSTLVYYCEGRFYVRSAAVLRLISDCTWLGKPLFIALLVPSFLRDGIYNLFAKNRHKFYVGTSYCKLLATEDRLRFLD